MDVDVIAPVVTNNPGETIAMRLNPAADQIELFDEREAPSPIENELAVSAHGAQAPAQGL